MSKETLILPSKMQLEDFGVQQQQRSGHDVSVGVDPYIPLPEGLSVFAPSFLLWIPLLHGGGLRHFSNAQIAHIPKVYKRCALQEMTQIQTRDGEDTSYTHKNKTRHGTELGC